MHAMSTRIFQLLMLFNYLLDLLNSNNPTRTLRSSDSNLLEVRYTTLKSTTASVRSLFPLPLCETLCHFPAQPKVSFTVLVSIETTSIDSILFIDLTTYHKLITRKFGLPDLNNSLNPCPGCPHLSF